MERYLLDVQASPILTGVLKIEQISITSEELDGFDDVIKSGFRVFHKDDAIYQVLKKSERVIKYLVLSEYAEMLHNEKIG